MPSLRGRVIRLYIKYYVGPKFKRAGESLPRWRELIVEINKSLVVPAGTETEPVQNDGLSAEWVRAPNAQKGNAILYLHGGGFIMGSLDTHRGLAAQISSAVKASVFALDYRLAPEHPFPASLEDTIAAYDWLLDNGYSEKNLAIGGDSAGGTLALQTLITLRDEGRVLPAAAFFISPVMDWVRFDGESYVTRAGIDPWITLEMCKFTASLYVGDNDPGTPLLYPIGIDLSGLPPLCIHVGDHEVLLSDAIRLSERARASNVEVEFKIWPGMWHGFQSSAGIVPESDQSLGEIGRFIVKHFGVG